MSHIGALPPDRDGEGTRPRRVVVVAYARNRIIGRDNDLPWRLRSDLKHFKAVTMGRPMIMGRKTFLSIGKPLPGRTSIVVTRDAGFAAEGVIVAHSLTDAFREAEAIAHRDGVGEIIIAGGGQIYVEALPQADRVIATEVALEPEGTVHFPALDPAAWHETSRESVTRTAGDDAHYDIVIYDRIAM